jgi:hypothetical protein
MMTGDEAEKAFLLELYRSTKAEESAQVSMYTVGAAMGLDRVAAKRTAEDLIGRGLVEIRTLSGAIGITADGISAAQKDGAAPEFENSFRLGAGPEIGDRERSGLSALLQELGHTVAKTPKTYPQIEELVIGIKTMEVYLLSARPKAAVVKALLKALQDAFAAAGDTKTAALVGRITH